MCVLFCGQSITEQEWSKQVAGDLRRRFPHADLEIENRAIGGFASQRWKVLPMFADTYLSPKIDDSTKENATTVVQGIANAKHTLEIIADNPASPPAIAIVRTYRPPMKAD